MWLIQAFDWDYLRILIFFPFVGFLMNLFLTTKIQKIIFIVACVLFSPTFFGYYLVLDWFNELCLMLMLAVGFARYLITYGKTNSSALLTFILSAFLFVSISLVALFASFVGFQKIEATWKSGFYKIKYVSDQGFAGGPLMKYELHHSVLWGLYDRKIETIEIDSFMPDTTCILFFEKKDVTFDKCKNELVKD